MLIFNRYLIFSGSAYASSYLLLLSAYSPNINPRDVQLGVIKCLQIEAEHEKIFI